MTTVSGKSTTARLASTKVCNAMRPGRTFIFWAWGPLRSTVRASEPGRTSQPESESVLRNAKNEKGASLVEFAFVLPFLALLAFGIVEFAFLLGQMNDVRYGAREAARLAASNAAPAPAMRGLVCSAMDLAGGQTVTFTDGATGDIGEEAVITVSVPVQSITGTGLISGFLPSTLSSTARTRLEEPSTNWSSESGVCP